jgi:hypothetical protein
LLYTHDAKDEHSGGLVHLVRVCAIESVGERKSQAPDRRAYIVHGLHTPSRPTGIMSKYNIYISASESISMYIIYRSRFNICLYLRIFCVYNRHRHRHIGGALTLTLRPKTVFFGQFNKPGIKPDSYRRYEIADLLYIIYIYVHIMYYDILQHYYRGDGCGCVRFPISCD